MWRIYVEKLFNLSRDLTEAEATFKDFQPQQPFAHIGRVATVTALRKIQSDCSDLHFPVSTQYLADIIGTLNSSTSLTFADVQRDVIGLRGIVYAETKTQLFFHVGTEEARYYNAVRLFGDEVAKEFSECSHDIAEAGCCFALGRWDACVHHLMVATEIAMRKWAKVLKLKTKVSIDLEDMEAILREAEAKLKQLKNQRRSARRDVKLKYLSETSAHFGFIKDAWRKYSAHGREKHDERSSKSLMNHVEDFMRLLCTKSRKPKSQLEGLFGLGLSEFQK
jgi:hypothetical protein